MSKNLLVVFGATGNQGGSTAEFVLDDPELSKQYSVRAITRSAASESAQALKSKGAEVVEADLEKPETLPDALKGAHTIFLTTSTQYQGNTREVETKQAKAACDEAVKAGVQYIIWSSMSHPHKITAGKLAKAEHFDVKAEIEEYIRTLPVKSAFYAPGSFMQNFLGAMKPRPSPDNDGTYVLGDIFHDSTRVPLIDITDTGKWIGAILAEPDKYNGAFFAAAQRLYSYGEIAQIMSSFTGKKVKHVQFPDEVHKGFLPETIRDWYFEMFLFIRDYGYYGKDMEKDVDWTAKQARGRLTTFDEFLKKADFKLD
ncbi:NAD(P)-binding protein [Polyplosphaeria fusca]|uniref:NAD(P)-binding protein n=1 Tax=Polyplosphaeria fusca TaxID=682080 RepID=A0A9P4R734_9PLEO|nr:NAD(P)-binding protein [Polyplosphaeria fusca]